jgi:hypothetical protein
VQVEPPLLTIQNETKPARCGVQFNRITAAQNIRMVFTGDSNAHVYGFRACS